MTAISAGSSLLGGVFGAIGAGKQKREAERKERKARAEMDRLKQTYSQLDTSNPYLNMENTMEDLTVNQQQAQFQQQQFQQSQANILDSMRGAAGGSGVAAVAQALAQQGQLSSQQASASIGQQEAANQRAAAAQASQIQGLERQGEMYSRAQEKEKVSTLLGMSQQETSAYAQQAAAAQQAKYSAIGGAVQGITGALASGVEGGLFNKQASPSQTPPPVNSNINVPLAGYQPTQDPYSNLGGTQGTNFTPNLFLQNL